MSVDISIEALGSQGDGIATHQGKTIFVAGALPGENVRVSIDGNVGHLEQLLDPSALRIEPSCAHFGSCGGCTFQHFDHDAYLTWKREQVVEALSRAGLNIEVEPVIACAPQSRRRATFSASHKTSGIEFGFQKAGSHQIVDVPECQVVTKLMMQSYKLFSQLSAIAIPSGKSGSVTVLQSRTGFDVAIDGKFSIDDRIRQALAKRIVGSPVGRLAVNGETVLSPRAPALMLGDVLVEPPAGAFVQAVRQTQLDMTKLVVDHLKKAKKVADLFAGSGTFALPLSGQCEVHAVESEGAALDALELAWRNFSGQARLKRVTVEKRDLFRRPLTALELNDFQAVVFDPPRAGALDQTKEIAKSRIGTVAAISCNPQSLARDLAILIEAGFKVDQLVPLDQFLWSTHIEVVALLSRKVPKLQRGSLSNM